MEHASFDPAPTTPCSTPQPPPRPVYKCLCFRSADSYSLDSTPKCSESSEDEEEDFQTVPLDDEHWTSKETPERTLCIHGMVYHIDYVHTYALMQTIRCPPTWTVWV